MPYSQFIEWSLCLWLHYRFFIREIAVSGWELITMTIEGNDLLIRLYNALLWIPP